MVEAGFHGERERSLVLDETSISSEALLSCLVFPPGLACCKVRGYMEQRIKVTVTDLLQDDVDL